MTSVKDNANSPAAPCKTLDRDVLKLLNNHRSELELSVHEMRELASLHGGLTKREEIASRVLIGVLARGSLREQGYSSIREPVQAAILYTDELLRQLEQSNDDT